MTRRLPKPLRKRVKRGDGFTTEITVVAKPELGERVRMVHRTPKGEFAFDYIAEEALELGRELIKGGRAAIDERRKLEHEVGR